MEKKEFIENEKRAFSNQMDPECEEQKNAIELKIVGVKYESKFKGKTFEGREYSYYSNIELEKGDIVEVPTRYGKSVAMVTRIDIPEKEIKDIKQYMKVIETKLDKEEFLNGITSK